MVLVNPATTSNANDVRRISDKLSRDALQDPCKVDGQGRWPPHQYAPGRNVTMTLNHSLRVRNSCFFEYGPAYAGLPSLNHLERFS